jgi:hypothetical protein
MQLPWFFAADHLPGFAAAALAAGDGALDVAVASTTMAVDGRMTLRVSAGSGTAALRTVPSSARLAAGVRLAVRTDATATTGAAIGFRQQGGSSWVIRIAGSASSTYTLYVGATAHSTAVLINNGDYVELSAFAHASAGWARLHVNGVEAVAVYDVATTPSGTAAFDRVTFSGTFSAVSNVSNITDLYIREAPEEGNPFYGPIMLRYLKPVVPDVQAQWTRNAGTTNASRVNQAHDGDTTYIETLTLDDEDIYNLEDLPVGVNSIIAVVPITVAVAPAGGAPQVEMGLETSAGTLYTQPRTVGVSAYQTQVGRAQTEKPGGGGWSIAAVNELKLRLKAS